MSAKLTHWSLTFLLFVALGIAFERPAHAYTDPGSTLLIFQSLGAVASGVLFYFRRQVKRLFSRSADTAPKAHNASPALPRLDT